MINIEQQDDKLIISYYNDQNKISIDKIPITDQMMFNYYESKTPDIKTRWTSFDGKPLNQVRVKRLSKFRIMEILYRYHKLGPGQRWNILRNPSKHFVDIETQILTSAIPSATNPQEKVRTIALSHKQHCTLYGSQDLSVYQIEQIENDINKHFGEVTKTKTKFTFTHRFIPDEKAMIGDFLTDMKREVVLLSGWNVLKFDWSYLCARYAFLGGRPEFVSPTGTMYGFYIADKWKKTEGVTVKIPNHIPIVDYMGLYEKMDTSISPKESSSLDWVSHEVMKVKKIKYSGSLEDLYKNDYQKYCFYNAVDAILVNLIDQKLQTFNTLQALAIAGRVQLHEGYFFSDIIENLFVCEYLERGRHFPEKKFLREKTKYAGAYVLEPTTGIHEWVMGYDAEAMYPSNVLAFNFGMDTYLGELDFEMVEKSPGSVEKIKRHILDAQGNFMLNGKTWLQSENMNVIRAATGALFDKLQKSVPHIVLMDNIKERLNHKKKAMDILVELNQLEKMRDSLKAR